jgi:hypothetical protein
MLRCPMCGSDQFDAQTRQISTGHTVWYGQPGKNGPKTRLWARACLQCGYVVSFVDLRKLHRRFGLPAQETQSPTYPPSAPESSES